jgi:hypothetical protein
MVPGKQAFKETQKTGILNQLDAYRLELAQRAGNRGGFMWHIGNRDLAAASTRGLRHWQDNMAPLLQFREESTAGHILELTVAGTPIPQKAQVFGKPGAIAGWIRFDHSANQLDVFPGYFPPLNSCRLIHQFNASTEMRRSPVPITRFTDFFTNFDGIVKKIAKNRLTVGGVI